MVKIALTDLLNINHLTIRKSIKVQLNRVVVMVVVVVVLVVMAVVMAVVVVAVHYGSKQCDIETLNYALSHVLGSEPNLC